jgi:RNA polymerase-binding transcription factor DksA
MNQEELNKYKRALERERIMVMKEIVQHQKPVDFGTDVDHFDEEADEAEEIGNQLAIAQDLKNRLSEIDIALGKIQAEKYGTCEKCGAQIEEMILEIDPESRFCRKCKLAAE